MRIDFYFISSQESRRQASRKIKTNSNYKYIPITSDNERNLCYKFASNMVIHYVNDANSTL